MIEAMACGTPVIAWDVGSVPEIVDDGVTGFIVRSIEEAVAAVRPDRHADRARDPRSLRAALFGRGDVQPLSRPLRPGRPTRRASAARTLADARRGRPAPQTSMGRYALKHDEEFLVADAHGDITGEGDGLFSNDTRLLSRLRLTVGGATPSLLSSGVSQDNVFFRAN